MDLFGVLVSAATLAGSVVWAAIHVGIKIGAMGQKLEAHATAVSSVEQSIGRMDGRVRDLERRVGPKGGG